MGRYHIVIFKLRAYDKRFYNFINSIWSKRKRNEITKNGFSQFYQAICQSILPYRGDTMQPTDTKLNHEYVLTNSFCFYFSIT